MDNSKKIIDFIKKQEIKPTPKWIFSTKNIIVWAIFILSVILGALAFSVILFTIQQSEFSMIGHMEHSKMEMFLGLLPIIWLVFVVVFFVVAIFSIRNSWKGYKFSAVKQVSISIALSIALGTLLFIIGGGRWIEHAFDVNISSYESLEERKQEMWSKPNEGYISGEIQFVGETTISIIDFNQNNWTIEIENSFIAPVVMLEKGEIIKVIGEMKRDGEFTAQEIRPWGGRSRRAGHNRNNR